MFRKLQTKQAGFTLVEIMIVVAIIGLLAAISIPSFLHARNQSQSVACINNLGQMESACQQLATANNLGPGEGQAEANIMGPRPRRPRRPQEPP